MRRTRSASSPNGSPPTDHRSTHKSESCFYDSRHRGQPGLEAHMDDEVTLSRRQLIQASATTLAAAKTATIAGGMVVADATAAPATTTAPEDPPTPLTHNNSTRLCGLP